MLFVDVMLSICLIVWCCLGRGVLRVVMFFFFWYGYDGDIDFPLRRRRQMGMSVRGRPVFGGYPGGF